MNGNAGRPSYWLAGLALAFCAAQLCNAHAEEVFATDLQPVPVVHLPKADLNTLAESDFAVPVYPAPLPVVNMPHAQAMTDGTAGDNSDKLAGSLRALLQNTALTGSRSELAENSLLDRFYASRGYKPFLITAEGLTPAGQGVVKRLSLAADDGLDVPQSLMAVIKAMKKPEPGLELALARAAVLYARDARGGRIDPTRLSKSLTPKLDLPDAFQVMTTLAASTDSDQTLHAYNPQHKGYIALRNKLMEWRDSTASLAESPAARKSEGGAHYPLDTGEFLANMERWRWLPVDAGQSRIEVNIPEYTLRLYENGHLKHTGRVVVGKTNTQTPVFSSVMDHLVINPSWGVPASILKNEFLPKLAADPDYAERHGYQVIRNKDERVIGIRQPPGERNALGFIKFMFPNEHAVYLHDTPQRNLFARDERAFSHGCVRVDQPFALANVLLSTMGYDENKLKSLIGKGEKTIPLQNRLPVHLTYFTLAVDEDGRIHRFADIYGHDQKLRTALIASSNKIASLR